MSETAADQTVLFEKRVADKVGILTLNRPEARNALSPELLAELKLKLALAEADKDVVAIVLTGSGEKAFCAGADLGKQFGSDDSFLKKHDDRFAIAEVFRLFQQCAKPIVGAANGLTLAGGIGVILSCDLVVAAERAMFGLPEVKRGLMPFMVMAVLSRQLGHKRALELVLSGESVTSSRAEQLGLINQVFPNEGFLDAAVQYTKKIAAFSPAILKLGKQAFYTQSDLPFEQALRFLHSQLTLNTMTEDAMEGISAFFQKRDPQWTGR